MSAALPFCAAESYFPSSFAAKRPFFSDIVPLKPVPYAQPWLAGVANLRGGLATVVDLAIFLGLREPQQPRPDPAASRLVALNPEMSINCALLVDRLAGLRGDEHLTPEPAEPAEAGRRPRFAGVRLRDVQGRVWQALDLEALSKHEQFLKVVV